MIYLFIYPLLLPAAFYINCKVIHEDPYSEYSYEAKIAFYTLFYPVIYPPVILMTVFCGVLVGFIELSSLIFGIFKPRLRKIIEKINENSNK